MSERGVGRVMRLISKKGVGGTFWRSKVATAALVGETEEVQYSAKR